MKKNIIIGVATTVVALGTIYSLSTKPGRIPLPPELEKERLEAEEIYAEYHKDDVPWVKAVQSSSDCPQCQGAVGVLNDVANKRNALLEQMDQKNLEARDLSDQLRLANYNETQEWNRVTDLVDIPKRSWWEKLPLIGSEAKIYDIVLPEDVELLKNPNKVVVPESLLAHFRELQRLTDEVREKIHQNIAEYSIMEADEKKVEQEYADAIAGFNACVNAEDCKNKKIDSSASVDLQEAKFSTSILEIRPIEKFVNGDKWEYEPNIYNRQKLGHADYAARTKFKIIKEVNCGKTQGIAWWQYNENNPMGIRWYIDACKDAGIVPQAKFIVEMYFDDIKFAECSYSEPGGSLPCVRFDK